MGSSSKQSLVQIKSLDSVRGIAILLVLWDHTRGLSHLNDRLINMLFPGHFGVDLFFVLSGFLITRILLAGKQKGDSVGLFLARRFLRIFPIYYLLLAIMAVLHPDKELLWCATYLSNFYYCFHNSTIAMRHTWSLCIEEHFYLIWPFIILFLPLRASFFTGCTIIVGSIVSAFFLAFAPTEELRNLVLLGSMCRFGSLALGGLVAFIELRIRSQPRRVLSVALTGFLLTVLIGFCSMHFRPKHFGQFLMLLGGLPTSLAVVLMGIVTNQSASWLGWVFNWSLLGRIGRISYGLYLYHFPIFHSFGLMDVTADRQPINYLLAALLSFAAAIVSFMLLERPLLHLKDRLRPRSMQAPGMEGLPREETKIACARV